MQHMVFWIQPEHQAVWTLVLFKLENEIRKSLPKLTKISNKSKEFYISIVE